VPYDLHTHSLASDGTRTPAEVVALAAEAGLDGLALTDHDTVGGWAEARAAAAAHGLDFVAGIELSAERGGTSVHLIGLWVERDDGALAAQAGALGGCAR
jgi:3',5'-nucleoside bisphosphate phosphatase